MNDACLYIVKQYSKLVVSFSNERFTAVSSTLDDPWNHCSIQLRWRPFKFRGDLAVFYRRVANMSRRNERERWCLSYSRPRGRCDDNEDDETIDFYLVSSPPPRSKCRRVFHLLNCSGEGYTFKQRERSSSLAGELSRAFNEITLKPEEVAPRLALLVALPLRENDPPSLYVLFPLSLFFVLLSGRMPSVADPWIGGRALRTTLLNPVRITCSQISRSYFLSFPSLVQGELVFLPVFHACFPCNKQNRATHAT